MHENDGNPLKILVIGDIHGRTSWKKIILHEADADLVVFLGDYFDSRDRVAGPKQLQNFLEIVEYKDTMDNASNTQVVMLFGNHDYHYMPWHTREPFSGYLPYMASKYRKALVQSLPKMHMAFASGPLLFSHAGVSVEWLRRYSRKSYTDTPWLDFTAEALAQEVNATFAELPKRFDFNGFHPSGDDPHQSPTWIRPRALKSANEGQLSADIIQVFGHTVVKLPETVVHRYDAPQTQRYYHADLLGSGHYLVCWNGQFAVKSIEQTAETRNPLSEMFPKTDYHKRVEFENMRAWSENMPARKREFIHPALKKSPKKED